MTQSVETLINGEDKDLNLNTAIPLFTVFFLNTWLSLPPPPPTSFLSLPGNGISAWATSWVTHIFWVPPMDTGGIPVIEHLFTFPLGMSFIIKGSQLRNQKSRGEKYVFSLTQPNKLFIHFSEYPSKNLWVFTLKFSYLTKYKVQFETRSNFISLGKEGFGCLHFDLKFPSWVLSSLFPGSGGRPWEQSTP